MYKMWKCITGKCKILYQMRNESRSFSAGSNPAKSDTAESTGKSTDSGTAEKLSTATGADTAADHGKTGKPDTTATTKKNENEKVTKTKNSEKISNKNETEKKSGSGAMVYLLIGAAVLIIILIAIIVLLFIKGNQPAKQDDITDKPVVTTEQTTETEMSTEQTARKDVSGQQEASEKTSEVINKEDTTGNEDMGTDGAVGEEEAEYILPESASRLLTEADLENLTQEDLRIARNEIYARHGRKFLDEGLQEYFNGKSWYNGTIEPDDFKEDMLSEIERTNEDTIVNYETKMGYR